MVWTRQLKTSKGSLNDMQDYILLTDVEGDPLLLDLSLKLHFETMPEGHALREEPRNGNTFVRFEQGGTSFTYKVRDTVAEIADKLDSLEHTKVV